MKNNSYVPFGGSYQVTDVNFLLKILSDEMQELGNHEREKAIQTGIHYSEMLPVEYNPPNEYLELFHTLLQENKKNIAFHVARVAEVLLKTHGQQFIIVSLARAGTPIGVMIKKYLEVVHQIDVPHYSISIIRGRGLDLNAIKYLTNKHPKHEIRFVDGWTGKGAISKELTQSCNFILESEKIKLNDELVVLTDPGFCAGTFSTREDILIPSACLNSTISGLVSRTVLREDLIGKDDFHGAKFYKELIDVDFSQFFIDEVVKEFPSNINLEVDSLMTEICESEKTYEGWGNIEVIQRDFGISNINHIKPGIGETTRVLLRRIPWKILVKNKNDERLKHILFLANQRDVEVVEYEFMTYSCCGLIKELNECGGQS